VIRRLLAQTERIDEPLFSSTGRVALRKETVAALVKEIERSMEAAGKLQRGAFSLRDLWRTAETHMAALGVSSDVRAQIQSHGLGGIQTRHYDRHDYMPEKRVALAGGYDGLRVTLRQKAMRPTRRAAPVRQSSHSGSSFRCACPRRPERNVERTRSTHWERSYAQRECRRKSVQRTLALHTRRPTPSGRTA
jgi:hypothetical protein